MLESIFNKVAGLKNPTEVFSSEYGEILENTYFEKHLRTAVSNTSLFPEAYLGP